MHELALSQGLIDLVCQQAVAGGAQRVLRVRLAIGALADVEPDAIEFCFEAVGRGTMAEGAILEISRPAGRAHCVSCAAEVTIGARGDPCPDCGGYRWMLVGGAELRLLELEVV
jgi:hydrogenase nickel incorporation protein HypA/HybF